MHMNIKDNFLEAGSVRTKYLESGEGEPLLLIHGLGHWGDVWKFNIEYFARKFRVIVPDVVGYGETDVPKDSKYDIDFYVDWLADFVNALELPKIILVGNSLGGAIVFAYTDKYPDKVQKLIAIAPAGFRRNLSIILRLMSLPIIGSILAKPSKSGINMFWNNTIYNKELIPEELVEEHYRLAKRPLGNYAFKRTLKSGVNFRGIKKSEVRRGHDIIKNITIPFMIIWGNRDKIIPMPPKDLILGLAPNVRLEIIENCGHTPMIEFKDKFHELALDFLS